MRHFSPWRRTQAHWLDDYARFMVIKAQQLGASWTDWPLALRDRHPDTLAAFDRAYGNEMREIMHAQFRAAVFWRGLRAEAAATRNQAVWRHADFLLRTTAQTCGRGVSCFCWMKTATPPLWRGCRRITSPKRGSAGAIRTTTGPVMEADNFAWWRARLSAHFEWFDWVRIDHFRGWQRLGRSLRTNLRPYMASGAFARSRTAASRTG